MRVRRNIRRQEVKVVLEHLALHFKLQRLFVTGKGGARLQRLAYAVDVAVNNVLLRHGADGLLGEDAVGRLPRVVFGHEKVESH